MQKQQQRLPQKLSPNKNGCDRKKHSSTPTTGRNVDSDVDGADAANPRDEKEGEADDRGVKDKDEAEERKSQELEGIESRKHEEEILQNPKQDSK